jgi:hypothetical protein
MELTSFGHLPGCLCQAVPNSLDIKPECPYYRTKDRRCGKQLSKQGCARMNPDGSTGGYCPDHYKIYCASQGWDPFLSVCANELCDKLHINLDSRKKITADNILAILGLPAKTKYNGRTTPTHHVREKSLFGKSRGTWSTSLVIDLASNSDADDESEESELLDEVSDGSDEESSESLYSISSDDERLCSDDEEVIGLW